MNVDTEARLLSGLAQDNTIVYMTLYQKLLITNVCLLYFFILSSCKLKKMIQSLGPGITYYSTYITVLHSTLCIMIY